jgi:hypothetical protein
MYRAPPKEYDDYHPDKDSIVKMVKAFRGMTRRRLNLLETYLVSAERAASEFRKTSTGKDVFNLSDEQIQFTYPTASKPGFNYELVYDQDFSVENEEVLNDMVPERLPGEDYFQEEEKPCIFGNDNPMSSSPIDHIRKSYFSNLYLYNL